MIKKLKKTVKAYLNKPIYDIYNSQYGRYVLLSYITKPFRHSSNRHTNYIEVNLIAKVFHDLGYSIDVVEYDSQQSIDFLKNKKYDILFGFGDTYNRALIHESTINAIKISYATGAHNCFQNNAEMNRIKYLYERKNIFLKPRRIINKALSVYFNISDAIITTGNENFTKMTFKKYTNVPVHTVKLPIYSFFSFDTIKRDIGNAKKHFLWFGSNGLIHKGLDLCLEVFSKLEDYHLHICGPKENDFFKLYENEIYHMPNIHYHGFVDVESKTFKSIVSQCVFTIFPSCSEGGGGALLTSMATGLIPITTIESSVDKIDEFGFMIEGTLESIEKTIFKAAKLDDDILYERSKEISDYVISTFTKENFSKQLTKSIQTIMIKGSK